MPPPLLSTLLRMAPKNGGNISDNFNRTVASGLGTTSTGGYSWQVLSGTWSVDGSRPTTSTSASSDPIAFIEAGARDVDTQLLIGASDAIYFRVVDQNNWWRVMMYGYQTSSCQTCYQTCCSTCCDTCYEQCCGAYYGCYNPGNGQWGNNTRCYSCPNCVTSGYSCRLVAGCYGPCPVNCNPYSCNCVSCNCYSCNPYSCNCTYYDNYEVRLQKNVAGSVSTVSSQVASSQETVRVITLGTNIQVTRSGNAWYNAAGTEHATATRHGIGRASGNYNSPAMDDYVLKWN